MKTRLLQAAKAVSLKSYLGCALALMAMCGSGLRAQNADAITAGPRARVAQAVDENQMVALPGRVNPQAKPSNDRGLVSDAQPLTRMHLTLQRSAEQQAALSQLMADQQNKNSANYHAWLTPQAFGKHFGPADGDVATLTSWLASHGFQNIKVSTGKTAVEFSGTVGQVRSAFRTEIHNYVVNGEEHFANVSVPQIPAALAPIIAGMPALHNFHSKPMLHRVGKFRKNMATGVTQPLFTFTDVNGTFFGLGPADFAKIYNAPSGFTGAGVSIAIVGRSNISVQDVCDFRTMFSLLPACPAYQTSNLNIILNGADPGLVSGDEGESDLDVEWAGAVAPGATIKFVATQTTTTDVVDGIFASAFFIVNNNIAHILSQSYGSCEANSDNTDQNLLWEQAAAQGITVVVAAGDNGAANCDDENSQSTAAGGIAVSGAASTPFDTAVGGTDFDDATTQTMFWNATNTSPTEESAKGYIPEIPWNDSCGAAGIAGCTAASANLNLVAGSGGPSAIYTTKPSWQVGFGDAVRDLPDVSLFAGDGNAGTFYIVCESDEDIPGDDGCNLTTFSTTSPFHDFQAVGGTSGSAPSFAGIMALVDQKTGQRQGVANYVLYNLAKSETFANCNSSGTVASTCVFNDVTKGNNAVACSGGSPDCSTKTAGGIGVLTTTTGGTTLAFAAAAGYDEATGLGSINVTNLVNNWTALSRIGTTTTLSGPSTATLNATVKYSGTLTKASGTAAPTGLVQLEDMATGETVDQAALSGSGTTYSISTPFMPAGSYNLVAHYGGDGVYAASNSAPIAINIAKAASTVVVNFVNFDVNNNPVLSTSAQTLQYGTPYILRVDVETPSGPCENLNTGAQNLVCPTGTIQLFKNAGAALNDFPQGAAQNATNIATLNDRGFIEDQPIQLPAGTYSISATYTAAANSSYSSNATSNAVAVTITQATTITSVASAPTIVTAGGTVTLSATVSSQSNSSQGPTGTVQFKNGATTLSMPVTCTPVGFNATTNVGALCTASLSTALSFVAPPSAPFELPRVPISTFILTALGLATAFLWGLLRTPADKRRLYACASVLLLTCAVAGLAGCGGGGGGGGGGGNSHADSITAVYSGDTNYTASTSTAVAVTVQ
jgi:Pro-kumamolisin, activation domain/Bacterial Ig-like domain (group 3)